MKSECSFYLDRAANCLDMAEQIDRQYRGEMIQIARGWVQLAEEEAAELGIPPAVKSDLTVAC